MSDPPRPNKAPISIRFSAPKAHAEWESREQAFRHEQERKDSDLRRTIIRIIGVFLLAVSALSFVVGVAADNGGTREWAQGLVTILVGGFVGFVTGRAVQ